MKIVIECGIGTNNEAVDSNMTDSGMPGASLRMWRDYFPNAEIIGLYIDAGAIFSEERITCYQCDQTSQDSVSDFVNMAKLTLGSVDIILDDGLHETHAGISFFENMIDYVRAGGFFIIEDVKPFQYVAYKDYFREHSEKYNVNFINLSRPNLCIHDNRLIVINVI